MDGSTESKDTASAQNGKVHIRRWAAELIIRMPFNRPDEERERAILRLVKFCETGSFE